MKNIKQIFHILSYIQYPLLVVALFFMIKPFVHGLEHLLENKDTFFRELNYGFIFLGVAISFSTLQDTNKTSLKFEKKIWGNKRYGKQTLVSIVVLILVFFGLGITGFFINDNGLKELASGEIILAIGLIGFLKTAVEVFDNHQEDKKVQ